MDDYSNWGNYDYSTPTIDLSNSSNFNPSYDYGSYSMPTFDYSSQYAATPYDYGGYTTPLVINNAATYSAPTQSYYSDPNQYARFGREDTSILQSPVDNAAVPMGVINLANSAGQLIDQSTNQTVPPIPAQSFLDRLFGLPADKLVGLGGELLGGLGQFLALKKQNKLMAKNQKYNDAVQARVLAAMDKQKADAAALEQSSASPFAIARTAPSTSNMVAGSNLGSYGYGSNPGHSGSVTPGATHYIDARTGAALPVYAAQGGLIQCFANGGAPTGMGGGQEDNVPAMLSDGEYVMDADTVAALGDGNTNAGASALDQMRHAVRQHKRASSVDKIPPKAKKPMAYVPKKGRK